MTGKIIGDHYYLEGEEVTHDEFFAAFPPPTRGHGGAGLCAWKRPLLSDALAVHPKQIAEAEARNRKHGVNVEYERSTGRAIIPDRAARRDLMRLERVHDNNGGYGDDTGGSKVGRLDYLPESPVADIPLREGVSIGDKVRRINH